MIALIDGDVICYACGFAAESKTYILTVGDEAHEFQYKKDMDNWMGGNLSPEETYHVEIVTKIPEVSHSLHNAKQLIEKVIEKTRSKDVRIFLTGKGNYRDKAATIRGYKAHRDKDAKPAHYADIKEYLLNVWQAEIVDGMEADDMLGIVQMQYYNDLDDYTCICSIDKDLDQIPGWHYNWKNDKLYKLNEEDAERYYAKQMLTGDSTDNILGIPGIGPKKADKILAEVPLPFIQHVLENEYKKAFESMEFKKKHNIPESMTWEEIYNETDQLIRIRRSMND